ncbi:MerR family transcriptional regulator [Bacillus haikouensis]|jgi:DNA-binding transcriptional MerR regulator/effector-binding domain-containing protein|uniref:MerR family transcriptional regulator n=1 Tax=Bacillus haikouensis TaxID=1510468 RepID=UPI0015582138|nr:MerR family transcriptional regulator [Bacillus haikouensis]NQD67397.1 MerR family transcriptional regulator [Bacillus haikouensis]
MKQRFRVGEVAKLFQLSSSTLRYYDEIGIFKPKYTDPESRYRYYTVEQFTVLETIIFLKNHGFSIKEIQQHLSQRTPDNTKELLEKRLDAVEKEIESLKFVAGKIKNKINTIEEGLSLRDNPSLIFRWFPVRAISYLYNDSPIDLMEESEALYVKDLEELVLSGISYEGFFTGDFGATVDVESLNKEGPVKHQALFELLHHEKKDLPVSYLESGMYACYPRCGPYETPKETYLTLLDRLHQHNYRMAGAPIEILMLDESVIQDENGYVTWIQIPVEEIG